MLKCDRDSRFDKISIVRISHIELSMGGVLLFLCAIIFLRI